MAHDSIIDLYERRARDFDLERGRSLFEKSWLDRFLSCVPDGSTILDIGCGMGEPIARYILDRGFRAVGVDSSRTLIDMCRTRFPHAEWHVQDMRTLDLGRTFDGILAWDSFFHLRMDDQRRMFDVLAAHAAPGAALMFTSGPTAGEAIGTWHGEPLYHASLSPEEYRALLAARGFVVQHFEADDPDCGSHSVWIASRTA